jgi:hypothetical protein
MGINYKTDTKKATKPFPLKFPEKYHPSARPPMFKSGWEATVFHAMDVNPFILEWGYEPFPIYYTHPIYMNYTVYYPDIYCHIQMDSGVQHKMLIEIKPAKYCVMPKKPKDLVVNATSQQRERHKKSMIRYQNDTKDYMVNMAKWNAAENWCRRNNFIWKILNEDNTNSLFK